MVPIPMLAANPCLSLPCIIYDPQMLDRFFPSIPYIRVTVQEPCHGLFAIHRSFANSRVLSSTSNTPCPLPCLSTSSPQAYPFALPTSSLPLPFTHSNHTAIASKHPCSVPVTKYSPQALHPCLPNLPARLPAQTKLPGVWMHIVGMDKLPTALRRHVVHIWGRN